MTPCRGWICWDGYGKIPGGKRTPRGLNIRIRFRRDSMG